MPDLAHLLPVLISLSLAAMVLAVGLDATLDDLLYLFRHPRRLLKAFLAISVVVPAAAVAAVLILPISPASKAGIVIMAIAPVPPLAPGKQLKFGGRKAYVYGLYVTFALLAVVIVPCTVAILDVIFGKSLIVSAWSIARMVLASVLLPLALGMAARAAAPKLAAALLRAVRPLSMLLLVVAFVPMLIAAWPGMASITGDGTALAIVLVVAAGLAAGHLLGGPEREDRVALALAAATRHPGIALMIAKSVGDKHVTAAVLLFMMVGLVVALPYQIWVKPKPRPPHLDADAARPT